MPTQEESLLSIDEAVEYAERKLQEFRERLDGEDPAAAFEWSNPAIHAAATLRAGRHLRIEVVRYGVERAQSLARGVVQHNARWPHYSTQPVSDFVAQIVTSVYAKFADEGML